MPVNVPNGHSSSSDQSRIGSSQLRGSNPLLFPKSHDEPYNSDLFLSPTSEYRGAPLWSWNNSEYCFENIFPWWLKAYLPPFPPPFLHLSELDKDQLLRQIDIFEEMGFGGFHMHTRAGLETPYLGPEFMQRVKDCVEYAAGKKPQMLACLYDEDKVSQLSRFQHHSEIVANDKASFVDDSGRPALLVGWYSRIIRSSGQSTCS